jgi:hypothetical protein
MNNCLVRLTIENKYFEENDLRKEEPMTNGSEQGK